MQKQVAIIGFGEAAQAFTGTRDWAAAARAYDMLTDHPASRAAKLADYAEVGVEPADSLAEALGEADLVLSLVTADQALGVASAATTLRPNTVYCDMNSVAPSTKQAAAAKIVDRGSHYVDVAIMSPVNPGRLRVPLLLSGPNAVRAERELRSVGFTNCRVVGDRVGLASTVKMIRSVIVKGLEALTAEAMIAAAEAGLTDEVLASLDASERALPWTQRADYNLERMMVHGLRRGDEMDEVVRTLESLGVEPALTRATAQRQRDIGNKRLHPQVGLDAKLAQLRQMGTEVE